MDALSAFVTAFKHEHRFNGPSFWEATELLFCFSEIYGRDLPTCKNPIRESWWPIVTEQDIDALCSDAPSLALFLKHHIGAKPLFRQMALDSREVRASTLPTLIVVDPQNDFVKPEGSLAVPGAENAIPAINALLDRPWGKIYVTADWHPENHCSFAVNNPGTTIGKPFLLPSGEEQIAWPVHCLQLKKDDCDGGAAFHKGIVLEKPRSEMPCPLLPPPGYLPSPCYSFVAPRTYTTIYKGRDATKEAYSGFAGSCEIGKTLNQYLVEARTETVVICGFATDYCVAATAIDAVTHGFRTVVVLNACRGVATDTTRAAIEKMRSAGVEIIEEF